MFRKKSKPSNSRAFSLVELIVTIAIIALLASLLLPTFDNMRKRSESTVCANNLQQIGLAVMQKTQDNNNTYPKIEGDPSDPAYAPEDGALSLLDTLRPYGITERTLRCPADVRGANYYGSKGTSYDWFPLIDGESNADPKIYTKAGVLDAPVSMIPLSADFKNVHRGKQNMLFADGHVKAY